MDGTVFTYLNRVGVVIRNNVREFLGAFYAIEEGGIDTEEAKALAALRALEFVANVFPFNMVFEGESAMVIRALRSWDYDLSKVEHIFELARTKACLFPSVAFQHVKPTKSALRAFDQMPECGLLDNYDHFLLEGGAWEGDVTAKVKRRRRRWRKVI
uniref:RNase H type-1 domain-containing protein n=1 Tax=Fagus sylvatica TaxID=28930 RepID=A0A2N9I4D6_FAGSY